MTFLLRFFQAPVTSPAVSNSSLYFFTHRFFKMMTLEKWQETLGFGLRRLRLVPYTGIGDDALACDNTKRLTSNTLRFDLRRGPLIVYFLL
ncbi:hypothetical protein EVAR_37242_1 [Eumeta japonica]|uniref:Uncharacterized protein n=1 Tax=Eumeta variegata TaxID=151549 RepID=A0A4C1Y9D8_EUMVA|nr:hypothetical protein EVAR_37242_1 [Eumeta japonica]